MEKLKDWKEIKERLFKTGFRLERGKRVIRNRCYRDDLGLEGEKRRKCKDWRKINSKGKKCD